MIAIRFTDADLARVSPHERAVGRYLQVAAKRQQSKRVTFGLWRAINFTGLLRTGVQQALAGLAARELISMDGAA